ncbi:MAG: EF-hand domain-containing protein [Terriglobales bacterium]|jgi:sulfatase maturation enzyme AslB (radical SAM superfamily)
MFKSWPTVLSSIAAVFLAGATVLNAGTTQSEKATGAVSPTSANEKAEHERKLAIATEAAKQLLLVMDTDKSGKVSKQEWMKFMEEEFDRLDVNHDGQLDVQELTKSRMRVVHPYVGK